MRQEQNQTIDKITYPKDLTGIVFTRLTVIKRVGKDKWRNPIWQCLCECGKIITTLRQPLVTGRTKSCGCYKKEVASKIMTTHGMWGHPAYIAWDGAKGRTTNPQHKDWDAYGGRGIKFCDEWDDSFEAFWRDMGSTWQPGLTLDRKDFDGNYDPKNCRWETPGVQSHNKRKAPNCSSQYVGVQFRKDRMKFQASIRFNGKTEYLGRFVNEMGAAIAYDDRSEELYGDRPNKTVKGGLNENQN